MPVWHMNSIANICDTRMCVRLIVLSAFHDELREFRVSNGIHFMSPTFEWLGRSMEQVLSPKFEVFKTIGAFLVSLNTFEHQTLIPDRELIKQQVKSFNLKL